MNLKIVILKNKGRCSTLLVVWNQTPPRVSHCGHLLIVFIVEEMRLHTWINDSEYDSEQKDKNVWGWNAVSWGLVIRYGSAFLFIRWWLFPLILNIFSSRFCSQRLTFLHSVIAFSSLSVQALSDFSMCVCLNQTILISVISHVWFMSC